MTCHDAAVLSLAGARHRPLLLRLLLERPTEEDRCRCPPRQPGESLAAWLCRLQPPRPGPRAWTAADLERVARRNLERAAALGIHAVPLGHPRYPPRLAAIDDPPPLLWVRGEPACLAAPAIAVVGSRAASVPAREAAWQVSAGLAAAGVVVVSGLARGIDAQAHQAALAAGGRTVAVLGSGVDWIYPAEHAPLAGRAAASGALVSELAPGTPPRAYQFPARNRIISGLSLAIVVVEAAEKSGALITASCAASQGREVMVVPGTAVGGRNRGGHLLIRDGARLVERAADVLQDLGVPPAPSAEPRPDSGLLSQLPLGQEFTVDDVAAGTGASTSAILAGLLELEVSGSIQRIGGGRFVRSSGRVLT